MLFLVPDSFGATRPRQFLREFNRKHEAKGAADKNDDGKGDGGQFANKAGGAFAGGGSTRPPTKGNFVTGFETRHGYSEVYKNPTDAEYKKLERWGGTGVILVGKDLYLFDRTPAMHYDAMEALKKDLGLDRREMLPLLTYRDGQNMDATVTDASRNTKWFKSPAAAKYIREHPRLRRLSPNISVSYYDEAIDGSWEG